MPQQFHEPAASVENSIAIDANLSVETTANKVIEDLIREERQQKVFTSPTDIVLPETLKAQMAVYGITDIERYEAVQAEVKHHTHQMTRRARLMIPLIGSYSVIMGLYALYIFLYCLPRQIFPPVWLTLIMFLPSLFASLPWIDTKSTLRAVQKTFPLYGLKGVGSLTHMLKLPGMKREAMDALIRLLPNLQASDADLLTKSQRDRLCKELERHGQRGWFRERQARFAVAILKAFEQVGDVDALPVVKALANANFEFAPNIVRSAARDCLPLLETRIAEQESKNTLLRASDVTNSGQNVLLRPAEESAADKNATEASHQLLRASILEVPVNTV